jgi:RHS repeat-associated protein
LFFVKHATVKTADSKLIGKLPTKVDRIAVIRKQAIQRLEFDFTGRMIASYDANNNQTQYVHDSLGRQVVTIQPPAKESKTRLATENYFDLSGNAIMQVLVPLDRETLEPIESEKRITRAGYDELGRLTKVIQPNHKFPIDGPTTYHEYDISGNLIRTTDPLGNKTNYSYDNLNRKISETNAEGGVTKFTYYNDGQMRSLIDPVGNQTSWSYNLFGRVSREIVTLGGKLVTRYFCYDANGNMVIKIDRNNRTTLWTHDKHNRPTSETWHSSWRAFIDNKQPIKKFTTTYNHSGKIESIQDGDNKFAFAYGIFGNKIKEVQNLSNFEKPIEFNFTTDVNGLNIEKSLKIGDKIDHTNKYETDSLNRITNISQTIASNNIKSVNIQYGDLGQLTKQTRFDSGKEIIVTKNKFDQAGRLTNISHTGNNNKIIYADYDLTWDEGNRITDFDFTYLNGPVKRNESKYRYDKTSQLIDASYNFMDNEFYKFDRNGNRQTAEIQGKKQTYKTGEYNRLLSDGNYHYEYDQEGNRISKTDKDGNITKYLWDHRNRLIKVITPTTEIEYLYDHLNRLVRRTENKIEQQYFVHDNWQIILQFNNKDLQPTHRYLWGTKQDELICDNNNWMLGDHLNTIRDIVKSDGKVAAHLEYNAFGRQLIPAPKDASLSFAYTGKLFDQTSDLQWNINRWYDSNAGRWISEDPIGFKGDDNNFYRFTQNMPVVKYDPYGLFIAWTCTPYSYIRRISVVTVPYGELGPSLTTNPFIASPTPITTLHCEETETYEEARTCTYYCIVTSWSRTYTRTSRRSLSTWSTSVGTSVFIHGITLTVSYGNPVGVGIAYTAIVEVADATNICNAARP